MDKTQSTIMAYDNNVNAFAALFMEHEPYSKHVVEFAALLSEGSRVLDVG